MKKTLAFLLASVFLFGVAATPAFAKKHHHKHHKKHKDKDDKHEEGNR